MCGCISAGLLAAVFSVDVVLIRLGFFTLLLLNGHWHEIRNSHNHANIPPQRYPYIKWDIGAVKYKEVYRTLAIRISWRVTNRNSVCRRFWFLCSRNSHSSRISNSESWIFRWNLQERVWWRFETLGGPSSPVSSLAGVASHLWQVQ